MYQLKVENIGHFFSKSRKEKIAFLASLFVEKIKRLI